MDARVTARTVQMGNYVQPGQALLALVPKDVWVTANFKETQLTYMHPGQPVELNVDAYPDQKFKGKVDSLQAGTGARFSLLPPENAVGNYVKVVQRVPVKIVFDEDIANQLGHRAGHVRRAESESQMSDAASITTVGMAPARQSVADCAGGDAGDVHGHPGHFHCRGGAAVHRGKSGRDAGRIHLGADELSGGQCDHPAGQHLVFQFFWAQTISDRLHRYFHCGFVDFAVWPPA